MEKNKQEKNRQSHARRSDVRLFPQPASANDAMLASVTLSLRPAERKVGTGRWTEKGEEKEGARCQNKKGKGSKQEAHH